MTDKEIIEGLKKYSTNMCSNCKVTKTICCNHCIVEIQRQALDLINRQQTEINEYKRNKKKIIFEIFNRLRKLSYKDARIKEGGGLEHITIVNINDINKCLREFLKEWTGDKN